MTFKEKVSYPLITAVIIIILSSVLSERTVFTGDEFGTLDIENIHKPIPYNTLVSNWISFFKPINPDDVENLRLSSLVFTLLGLFLIYYFYINNRFEIIIFSLLMATSGFLYSNSIFFRYYSYYFLTSTFTFLLLTQWIKNLSTNQKLYSNRFNK